MDLQDFIQSLIDKPVRVISKKLGKKELTERIGYVVSIEPEQKVVLQVDQLSKACITFGGTIEGIYQILEWESRKVLYQNQDVLNEYQKGSSKKEKEFVAIHKKGKFFIDD
ncbi:hypothetical protein HOD29_02830 [archaeon]|jgi:hypothetical protein|nr:hypothetical protein [archaeon]